MYTTGHTLGYYNITHQLHCRYLQTQPVSGLGKLFCHFRASLIYLSKEFNNVAKTTQYNYILWRKLLRKRCFLLKKRFNSNEATQTAFYSYKCSICSIALSVHIYTHCKFDS